MKKKLNDNIYIHTLICEGSSNRCVYLFKNLSDIKDSFVCYTNTWRTFTELLNYLKIN